jgi:hypothetical protein
MWTSCVSSGHGSPVGGHQGKGRGAGHGGPDWPTTAAEVPVFFTPTLIFTLVLPGADTLVPIGISLGLGTTVIVPVIGSTETPFTEPVMVTLPWPVVPRVVMAMGTK